MSDGPSLKGYFDLLFKVFVTMLVLIFWGVLIAVIAMAVPFILSLVCVLALTAAGALIFSWLYVWIGAMLFLCLIAVLIN